LFFDFVILPTNEGQMSMTAKKVAGISEPASFILLPANLFTVQFFFDTGSAFDYFHRVQLETRWYDTS